MKCITRNILIVLFVLCFSSATVAATTELLSENFNACERPDGWTVENFGGFCDWTFATELEENGTNGEGCFAYAKSDQCPDQPMDTALITSSIDCSAKTCSNLSFTYDIYSGRPDTTFAVEISIDGGTSWENIWLVEGVVNIEKQSKSIDITMADGYDDVQVRFRYTASSDWWWQLDDVVVSLDEKNQFNWLLFLPAITGQKSP